MESKNIERLTLLSRNYQVSMERLDNCCDFLKKNRNFQSEDVLIDYIETQVKMLYYGAVKKLPGE